MSKKIVLAVAVALSWVSSSSAEEYRAVFWNLQSGDSKDALLASQVVEKGAIDFWGFSEVRSEDVVNTIKEKMEQANPGVPFVAKISEDGGGDRLAIIFRADRLSAVPYGGTATVDDIGDNFFEVDNINVGRTIRPALGVQLESNNGDRVIVLVNHWKCCGDPEDLRRREKQAIQMNAFAIATPGIPIISGGDFNIPLNRGGQANPAFQEVQQLWEYKEPQSNVGTYRRGSVLDAVFTTNKIPSWNASTTILNRDGNTAATTSTFTDSRDSTDHRPLLLIVESDSIERLEALREAVADMRAALQRMEAELSRLEANN